MDGYHNSRWYARHPEAKRPSRQEQIPHPEPPIPPGLQLVRRIIGASFVIAGVELMDTMFWLGYVLGCLGFVLLVWEVCTEPELIKRPGWIQIVLVAACFAGF